MSLLSRLAVQAARAYGILSSADKTKVVADYLVVAGGGGGGVDDGGGGGAGGYQSSTFSLSTLNTYSITVGAGGTAPFSTTNGGNGSNSIISGTGLTTLTSIGGGGGGGTFSRNGASGGSGGGGSGYNNITGTGGSATSGQGNAGGTSSTNQQGAGGGGAGGAGGSGGSGTGGVGLANSISGSSVYYAGGGGGCSLKAGGNGGGGTGAQNSSGGTAATAGTANTGGGGGAASAFGPVGAAGGSGIVIISYTSATPKFVGGTITTSGGKQIHTFTSSGTLSPITPITASYLVVAGGGGAVGNRNGGGGAGGLLTSSTTLYSGATYIVTIGAGGAGGAGNAGVTSTQDGSNSVLSGTGLTTLTAIGGGGGGGTNNPSSGRSGGSGGGAGGDNATGATGGTGTSGQGFAGGTSATGGGGGGGGASAVGSNGASNTGGNGGAGTASSISGTSVTYAGGGGGGATTTAGTGGAGGGGNGAGGSPSTQSRGVDGTQNSGGGAGGGSNYGTTPVTQASGGSGIVIISYAGSQVFNGGLVTTSGGNTIHTFTSTGALTPLTNNLNNSLRFRNSASASITRTPTVAGNRRTFTWSAWVKRGLINAGTSPHQFLFSASTSTTFSAIDLYSNNIRVNFGNGTYLLVTNQVFRDPSAWYHIVLSVDTTQATDANRVKLYINGNQASFASGTYPTQNYDTSYNNTVAHRFGVNDASDYFDGYLADFNFIDGQALEPYYFGNNDANGVWKPIQYKGTYGTNGFYLTFGNTTSTTTLGYDSSPNGNNWTCNNISLTAGTTYDAMTDVPTNTSATVGNYCVLNPLDKGLVDITGANLNIARTSASASWAHVRGTMQIPSSGKWYAELTFNSGSTDGAILGLCQSSFNLAAQYNGSDASNAYVFATNGYTVNNNTATNQSITFSTGDIINMAFDRDTNKVWFGRNNTWLGSGNPSAGTNETMSSLVADLFPLIGIRSTTTASVNFGQRPFSYTPPTGFVALNTYNLPTPTILQGNKYMDATLWTGNGSAGTDVQTVVNAGQFKPDLVWTKSRSNAISHHIGDSVRGIDKTLFSNTTGAEATYTYDIHAFNSNGFTVGNDGSQNTSGYTYVGWQWQAGQGTTSSNTSGSITSTVSVNASAGFSIVTYTGNATSGATVGHGLGVAPSFIIAKNRSSGVTDWPTFHVSTGNNGGCTLNEAAAKATTAIWWNNTTPNSTLVTLGSGSQTNGSGNSQLLYCWAEIAGFSKFGSYTGNGSADGPFIATNFAPKFVLIKSSSDAGTDWWLMDSARSPYNIRQNLLSPNTSSAENASVPFIDFLSNGFKIRTATAGWNNNNGSTYIYACFASNPFKSSNAV